jgi:hypothetical protein
MSETKTETQLQTPAPQAGKLASVGSPQPAKIGDMGASASPLAADESIEGAGTMGNLGAPPAGAAQTPTPAPSGEPAPQNPPQEISDEAIKAYFEKQGIAFDGDINALKEKLKPAAAPAAEPTAEEKAAQEIAIEQRVIANYIANGGTVEQYAALKSIVAADTLEFAMSEARRELRDAGFPEDHIDAIIAERYYQVSDEEIEQLEDESDKAFVKRKKEYGSKKLEARSVNTKKQAEDVLKTLRQVVENENLLKQREEQFSSKIDEHLAKLPRKITFQLGEAEGQVIPPIEFDVNESSVTEIANILKNPEERQKFFYNQDNSLNLENITNVMLRNKALEEAVKVSYHTGGTRQAEIFKKVFPHSPKDLGVGGAQAGNPQKGKFVGVGQPEVARSGQNR